MRIKSKREIGISAKNYDPVRRGLGRDASGSGAIVHNKKIFPCIAGKSLTVSSGDAGIRTDVQFQLIFFGKKIPVKVGDHNIFGRFGTSDESRLILGRINERNRLAAVVEGSNAHTCTKRGIVHYISARRKDEIYDSVHGAQCKNLVTAVVPHGGHALNNSYDPDIVSRRSHSFPLFIFYIKYESIDVKVHEYIPILKK